MCESSSIGVSLSVLFGNFFARERKISKRSAQRYLYAISRLDEFLDCDSKSSDLNKETLELFAQFISIHGENTKHLKPLIELWQFAYEHELATCPDKLTQVCTLRESSKRCRNRLDWQFRFRYLPRRKLRSLHQDAEREYLYAIRSFDDFLQRPCELADVDEAVLLDFDEWMTKQGRCQSTRKKLRNCLRRIAERRLPKATATRRDTIDGREVSASLLHFLETSYKPRRLKGSTRHTLRKYKTAVHRFAKFLEEVPTFDHLDDELLVEWIDSMTSVDDLAVATAESYAQHIRSLWTFAWKKGYVELGPTTKRQHGHQREPIAYSEAEVQRLFETVRSLEGRVRNTPACNWWFALALVLYYTGTRVGAALSLRWEDVNEDDQTVLIRADRQKTGKELRRRVSPATMEAIRKLKNGGGQLVFDWPLSRDRFHSKSREIFLHAGFPDDRRYRWHGLRRTHGTLVAARLGDFAAAESLQHSSVQTFRKSYRDSTRIPGTDVVSILPDPYSFNKDVA